MQHQGQDTVSVRIASFTSMNILLAENTSPLREMIARDLRKKGHRVTVTAGVEDTRQTWCDLPADSFDAVILDVLASEPVAGPGMPRPDLELLREARARGDHVPVLLLTTLSAVDDRIGGLEAGADDYLAKPFDLDELNARLRALERRTSREHVVSRVGALSLDRTARRFSIAGESLRLPPREFEVLWRLMTPPRRLRTKEELAAKMSFASQAVAPDSLEVYVFRLRKRIADSGAQIKAMRGLGYLLEAAD